MTDNCYKNVLHYFLCFSTYIHKVKRQELCPPAPLLPFMDTDWGMITSSTILLQWFRSLTGETHKHLKSCWIALELSDRSVHRQLCKRQPPASQTIRLDSSIPCYCPTPLETPPRWSLQKQLLPSCRALYKLESQSLNFFSHVPNCGITSTNHCGHCSLLIMVFTGS